RRFRIGCCLDVAASPSSRCVATVSRRFPLRIGHSGPLLPAAGTVCAASDGRAHLIPRTVRPFFPALGLIAVLVAICAIVHLTGDGELQGILTEALIYMVMVVALSIFVSNSGVISFGHVTFALIGAYASAWQTCCSGIRGVFMPGLPEFLLHTDVPVI